MGRACACDGFGLTVHRLLICHDARAVGDYPQESEEYNAVAPPFVPRRDLLIPTNVLPLLQAQQYIIDTRTLLHSHSTSAPRPSSFVPTNHACGDGRACAPLTLTFFKPARSHTILTRSPHGPSAPHSPGPTDGLQVPLSPPDSPYPPSSPAASPRAHPSPPSAPAREKSPRGVASDRLTLTESPGHVISTAGQSVTAPSTCNGPVMSSLGRRKARACEHV